MFQERQQMLPIARLWSRKTRHCERMLWVIHLHKMRAETHVPQPHLHPSLAVRLTTEVMDQRFVV